MENFSIVIWNELSRFVGTEEQIFIRRRKYELESCIKSRGLESEKGISLRHVLGGSVAEGLALPGSDIDIMIVLDEFSLSDSYTDPVSDMLMDTTDIKPGFVRLRCHDNIRYSNFSSALAETDNGLVLSSLLFRDIYVDFFPSSVCHGQCSTFVIQPTGSDCDILFCFSCKTWPVVAYKWIVRNRNNIWPPRDLISDIERDGCLLVPIGNPNSQDSHMQWRISFSIAEKKLIDSINHTQFLCYGLLKLYLRHVINSNTEIKDLICSYFLKTCLFYCIEEECIIWNKENFLNCFWTCLRRLIKWVKDEYCPNYFIKEKNMFEGKICGDKGKRLLGYLTDLYQEGLHSLRRIPCLTKLQPYTMYSQTPTVNAVTDAEREYFCDTEIDGSPLGICYASDTIRSMRFLVVLGDMVQKSTSNIDRVYLTFTHYRIVYLLVQLLFQQVCTKDSNKNIYKHMKEIESFIINNCMSIDKCTGMLLLATILYLKGQYKEVVIIVQKVLKSLEYSTFPEGYSNGYIKQSYMNEICGKGLTLYQKLKCDIFAFTYLCRVDSKFYPLEIERELVQCSSENKVYINPFVYSYVLMFLSYLHMNSRQNMIDTLNEFYSTVYGRRYVTDMEFPLAFSLLEKCIHILNHEITIVQKVNC